MGTLLAATMVGTASPSQAADTQITLNSSGGTNTTDGIRVVYKGGSWQVIRQGTGQLYLDTDLPENGTMTNGI